MADAGGIPKDRYTELTGDDEKSRRVASLALAFMNATTLTDDQIWQSYYSDIEKRDSYRVTFRRDRACLAACGIILERCARPDGASAWRVDEQRSFADSTELSDEDALAIDVACLPLVDDANFPFGDDLRLALAKIDGSFDDTVVVGLAPADRTPDRVLATVRSCLSSGTAVEISYTDAHGTQSERLVAPYGMFGLRDSLYLVAPAIDEAGEVREDSTKTYRIDRIGDAKPQADVRFSVPEDFDVRDWIRLPFQIGPASCIASFVVPEGRRDELTSLAHKTGRLEKTADGLRWLVEVSDVGAAASWSIAEDLVPTGPVELVETRRALLEGVVEHG